MKQGSKGEQVQIVQRMLQIEDDGDFGPQTEKSVRNFQQSNSIPITGEVDTITLHQMYINHLELKKLTNIIPNKVLDEIPYTADKFGITTKLRLCHFLSQCAHESGNFKFVIENLNYSEAALLNVFRRYFNVDEAKQYARQPERIANRVYANRMGNGNESSGDGWKYRGRGYIQLTGK